MSHHILMDATKSSGFLGDLLKIGKFFSAASANSNMRLTQKLWDPYWQMVETSHYFMMLPQFSPPWMEQNKRKLISLSLLYQIQYSQYNDFRLSADFFSALYLWVTRDMERVIQAQSWWLLHQASSTFHNGLFQIVLRHLAQQPISLRYFLNYTREGEEDKVEDGIERHSFTRPRAHLPKMKTKEREWEL